MTKWVYGFGDGAADGEAGMRELLGGKGANLAEMCNLGLPVPPGFSITTEVCTHYYDHGESYPDNLEIQVEAALADVEQAVDAKFGDETVDYSVFEVLGGPFPKIRFRSLCCCPAKPQSRLLRRILEFEHLRLEACF